MATPYVVEGWNPLGGRPPASDDDVFELLTAAVFQARFRPAVVQARWPAIRQAFAQFALADVATWPDACVEALLQADGMIRNRKKVLATLRNARDLAARGAQHGSVLAYLRSFGGDLPALLRDVDGWAHYIGAPSIRWWLQVLGSAAGR